MVNVGRARIPSEYRFDSVATRTRVIAVRLRQPMRSKNSAVAR